MKGDIDDLVRWVYGDMIESNSMSEVADRCIICPTNKTVDLINSKVMEKFPGDIRVYRSIDTVPPSDSFNYPSEFLNTLAPSGLPPHKIGLKIGCPIMLLRNMHPQEGHCNGTKYIVTALHGNIIEAVISQGAYKGNKIYIPRIPLKPTDGTYPFELSRKQFPIRACFAITSNKAQGQTLRRVGVYLDRHFFSHGQYYVAQSRVGERSALKILCVSSETTNNVVYPEVL